METNPKQTIGRGFVNETFLGLLLIFVLAVLFSIYFFN